MTTISPLMIGEPAPWFSAPTAVEARDNIAFDELGGRYIALFFLGSAARPDVAEALAELERNNDLFDYERALLLGISSDPADFDHARLCQSRPGHLFLWDANGVIAKRYGAVPPDARDLSAAMGPVAFILSPALQIVAIMPLAKPTVFAGEIVSLLRELLASPSASQNAPVLVVPQVFDRNFCHRLVGMYDATGGREIGLIEHRGKIIERTDSTFRKRLDFYISDEKTLKTARELLERRLLPIVYRAFQFRTTRIERYLVGCYDAATGGYFRPHRDNTAPIVAHRRFAVTINLNEGYEGGDLCFPEFDRRTFRSSPGDAIVFSCSLLHEVRPVTHGRRYAFLSFLYDEQSQRLRESYTKTASAAPINS